VGGRWGQLFPLSFRFYIMWLLLVIFKIKNIYKGENVLKPNHRLREGRQ
jgi:hypothetical protein